MDVDASAAGYARAIALRCQYGAASGSSDYPDGALIVALDPSNEQARAAGYADAISLAFSQNQCFDIEDLGMLGTDYAVDFELGNPSC
ncbi:MAG: hypothetical protein JO235_19650 [Chroococcidiopsidaceae cyanobacterium CP_BM_RX_35]|nr:hypothetical protein [Chroococcidiopsidaceae cyanobacterium CP_BM_RX_35]